MTVIQGGDAGTDLAFQDRLIDWFNVEGKGYTLFRTFKWNCAVKQRRREHANISLLYFNYFLLIVFTVSWITSPTKAENDIAVIFPLAFWHV